MNAVERIRRASDAPARARRGFRIRADRLWRVADTPAAPGLTRLPRALFGGDLLDLFGRRLRERLEPPAAALPEDAPAFVARGGPDAPPAARPSPLGPPPAPDREPDDRLTRDAAASDRPTWTDLAVTVPPSPRLRADDSGRTREGPDRIEPASGRAGAPRGRASADAESTTPGWGPARSPGGGALATRLRAYLDATGAVDAGVAPLADRRADPGGRRGTGGTATRAESTAVTPLPSPRAGSGPTAPAVPRGWASDPPALDGGAVRRPWHVDASLSPPTPRETSGRELHAMARLAEDDLAFRMAEVLREEARRHGVPLA